MIKKHKIYVIVSLDVEEEGLFSGKYKQTNCSIKNISLLPKLAPLTTELGYPLTLFCSYTIFQDQNACKTLAWMRDNCHAEIGAHLHHWSTPPFSDNTNENITPLRTDILPEELLQQKLHNLLEKGKEFLQQPITSFRMGRWDLKSKIRHLLTKEGLTVDSSICPLRAFKNGPNHFLAPTDPFWTVDKDNTSILEVPITQVPLFKFLSNAWYNLTKNKDILDNFHFWGALSPNPVWHNQHIMRLATCMHTMRDGKVLSLFWHSSEMLAGASPNIPDEKSANALLKKIYNFLLWLNNNYDVEAITMSKLHSISKHLNFPTLSANNGDW